MKWSKTDKYKDRFDLLPVPNEVIIRELRIELGKANAYILELEGRSQENLNHYLTEIKGIRNNNRKLREKVFSLNHEISELRNRIAKLSCQNNTQK